MRKRRELSADTVVLAWMLIFVGICAGLYYVDHHACVGTSQPRHCAD